MKANFVLLLVIFACLLRGENAVTPPPAPAAPDPRLHSDVFPWDKMPVTPNPLGERRTVFDGSTATVDKLHCHITTLNAGERSGAPRKHLQEEVIIIKDGTVEAHWDDQAKVAGPGSVIFFAAGATTFLQNVGQTPATYTVLYYYTPQTPKR